MKVPVLIPRIFDHPHTYLSKKFGKLKTGSIVSVPFGNEEEIGVVWDKDFGIWDAWDAGFGIFGI